MISGFLKKMKDRLPIAGSSHTQGGRLVTDASDQQPFEPGEYWD